MDNIDIARVCYEANRAYCKLIGDDSQVPWDEAPDWQRDSTVDGVRNLREDVSYTPRHSHESWLEHKVQDGWSYGPIKDAETKQHPCMVPYDRLPSEQQRKDALFHAIVRALE